MTTATRTYPPKLLERAICARSFREFLARVRIQEPPSPGDPHSGGVIPWQPWPHLMELAAALTETRLLAVLKARQVGVTWTVAAYLDWLAIYRPGSDWLLLSRTEIDAADFLGRVAAIHRLLPPHLSVPLAKPPTALSLSFSNGSKLTAMASTEDAGRGHAFSGVAQDEADFHPYLAENYAAAKPTIDAGGQMIQVSTANKRRMDSLFKGIVRGAPANGWRRLFYGWQARPGRDGAWYGRTKAAVPPSAGMSPDLYMEQEYPGTEAEALAPSTALAYFGREALTAMLDDCREPLETRGGLVRVWRKPVVAARYVAFGDCAWGEKGSYSCLVVADWQTGEQVAEVYGRPAHDELALSVYNLCREYNQAYLGIEDNGEGRNVVKKLWDLGYGSRMYCRTPDHKEKEQRSWQTDAGTRPVMLGELEEAVRMRRLVVRCKEAVSELMSFIRDEKGRPGPAAGAYADHVMAWAGLWQVRKHAMWGSGSGRGQKTPWGWT